MKRYFIITAVLVVAIVCFGVIGTVPRTSAAPPEGFGSPSVIVSPLDEAGNVKVSVQASSPLPVILPPPQQPQKTKIIDGTISSTTFPSRFIGSGWLDVKGYNRFKVYIKLTPVVPVPMPPPPSPLPPSPNVNFSILDSAGEGELGFAPIGFGSSWAAFPDVPSPNAYFATTFYFEGLYSEILLNVGLGQSETNGYMVEAWLLKDE